MFLCRLYIYLNIGDWRIQSIICENEAFLPTSCLYCLRYVMPVTLDGSSLTMVVEVCRSSFTGNPSSEVNCSDQVEDIL